MVFLGVLAAHKMAVVLGGAAPRLASGPAKPCGARSLHLRPPPIRLTCVNVNRIPMVYGIRDDLLVAGIRHYAKISDIIILQEAFGHILLKPAQRITDIAKAYGFKYFANAAPSKLSVDLAGSGLMILSKYRLHDSMFQPYGTGAYAEAIAIKGLLTAMVEVPGWGRLLVGTTHLQAYYDEDVIDGGFDTIVKDQYTKMGEFWKKAYDAADAPCLVGGVVGGDFNIDAMGPLGAREAKSLASAGLDLLGPSSDVATHWTEHDRATGAGVSDSGAPLPGTDTETTHWKPQSIDRLYCTDQLSGSVEVQGLRVGRDRRDWTDHAALYATIELNN